MNEFRPKFLTVEIVLHLHARSIQKYGGDSGIRDRGLLESALAQPMASFGGQFLHPTIADMAAAYLFHLAKNHAFVDGNKRIAAVASVVFIRSNGFSLRTPEAKFEQLVLGVAKGTLAKSAVAQFFESEIIPLELDRAD